MHIANLIDLANHYALGAHYTPTEDRPGGQSDYYQCFKCWRLVAQEINNLFTPQETKRLIFLRALALKQARIKNPDFERYKHAPKYKTGNEALGISMEPYIAFVNKMLKVHGLDIPTIDPRRSYL